jgi:uncharacterized protein HemX
MSSETTTQWPLLDERPSLAPQPRAATAFRQPRSTWLLVALAFLCGGLVSAAGFAIGWRHQAQRGSEAEAALASATKQTHALEARVAALRASLGAARRSAARRAAAAAAASAAERALAAAGAKVGADAGASDAAAATVSAGAGSLTAAAGRIAGELKTLGTYLTTTPTGQLDPGYVASQTAYLSRQLAKLQGEADSLDGSIASFQTAVRTLAREASALRRR